MLDFTSLVLIAFFLEMVDNSLGGGFGTILSPLLIILGYDPKVIVPAILMSEMISGLWGGGWHIRFKSVNFKAVGYTLTGSLIGMVAATFIIGKLLPSTLIKQYISVMTTLMGIFVVIRSFNIVEKHSRPAKKLSSPKFALLGALIGFNKGGSGGNYGPLSVSAYMLLGLSAATAIGTTTIAEGLACTLGVALYSQVTGIVLSLAIPISIGAFVADPISAWINNQLKIKLEPPFHGRLIGVAMTALGILAFLRAIGFI